MGVFFLIACTERAPLEFGLSQIPKAQARLLPNKTLPIPGDEEHYAVGLEVFHQLHCLV